MPTRRTIWASLPRLAIGADVAIRCPAVVVAVGLAMDLWPDVASADPDGDGLAFPLFVALCAYVVWSSVILAITVRRWRHGTVNSAPLLVLLGVAGFVRASALRMVLDEPNYFGGNWRTFEDLMTGLVAASWLCVVLTGVAALAAPLPSRAPVSLR